MGAATAVPRPFRSLPARSEGQLDQDTGVRPPAAAPAGEAPSFPTAARRGVAEDPARQDAGGVLRRMLRGRSGRSVHRRNLPLLVTIASDGSLNQAPACIDRTQRASWLYS